MGSSVSSERKPEALHRADYHVHTSLSRHGSGSMEEYVHAAIAAGLDTLVFLEHLEAGIIGQRSTWLSDEQFATYHREGRRLQDNYQDRIRILVGLECGYNPNAIAELRRILQGWDWDWVGISCHFLEVRRGAGHCNLFSKRPENLAQIKAIGPTLLYSLYLEQLGEAIETLPGQHLCHLDGALRHYPGFQPAPQHWATLQQLLTLAARHNLALEVNTSGIDIRGEPFPRADLLALAQQQGLPLLLASDAHHPHQVGRYFDTVSLPV